jgi:sec-independent protein translocase protein TatC
MTSPSLPQPARAPRPGWRDILRALSRSHRKARVELSTSLPLLAHLEELRRRTFTAVAVVAATTLLSFIFADQLVDFLTGPIGGRAALVSIEITENMAIFMRVSLLSGVVLGMPGVVYQVLRFVLPGLTGRERRWLLLGVPLVSLLFLSGVAFAWFVMIPVAIPFLVNFMGITTQMRPANYFQFITSLMFWMGLCFEMPAVLMVLTMLKVVTARQLAGAWRYAVVLMAIVAAAITPTVDPVNMGLVMLPLAALYLVSLLLAALVQKR